MDGVFVMSASSNAATRTYTAYCGTTETTFQVVVLVNTFDDVPNGTWFTESARVGTGPWDHDRCWRYRPI